MSSAERAAGGPRAPMNNNAGGLLVEVELVAPRRLAAPPHLRATGS